MPSQTIARSAAPEPRTPSKAKRGVAIEAPSSAERDFSLVRVAANRSKKGSRRNRLYRARA